MGNVSLKIVLSLWRLGEVEGTGEVQCMKEGCIVSFDYFSVFEGKKNNVALSVCVGA